MTIMPKQQSKQTMMILIVFAIVMAFLGYEMMQFRRAGKQVHGVAVMVRPSNLMMKTGESFGLEARVVGSENTDITWRVQEGDAGGKVTAVDATHANYTAPAAEGVYHVVVTSKADEAKDAIATALVTK